MLKNLCQKMFGRSLWVYDANSGGCNGCDIEVLNALTSYYDVERFGIKLVGSPRHADVMLCQGPALRSTAKALRRAFEAMPAPKLVFAIGSCACGGGMWFDSYAIIGPIEKILPVNYYTPGRPPRLEAIIYGVAVALAWWIRRLRPSTSSNWRCSFPATTLATCGVRVNSWSTKKPKRCSVVCRGAYLHGLPRTKPSWGPCLPSLAGIEMSFKCRASRAAEFF